MKNKLLPLFIILGSYSAYSQVVVGNTVPTSNSAQLEVFAADKGILIPQVKLISTTDKQPIGLGIINSLLIFNIATAADVTPGYYYWYTDRWNRIVTAGEVSNGGGNVMFDPITNQFSYIDISGNTQSIDINAIVKANETITTLTNNGTGSYNYKNEAGTNSNINVVQDVIDNSATILSNSTVKKEITNLVKSDQTITILVNNNDGTYLYTSEDLTPTIINVVGDVITNASDINDENSLENYIDVTPQTSYAFTSWAGAVNGWHPLKGKIKSVSVIISSGVVSCGGANCNMAWNGAPAYQYFYGYPGAPSGQPNYFGGFGTTGTVSGHFFNCNNGQLTCGSANLVVSPNNRVIQVFVY